MNDDNPSSEGFSVDVDPAGCITFPGYSEPSSAKIIVPGYSPPSYFESIIQPGHPQWPSALTYAGSPILGTSQPRVVEERGVKVNPERMIELHSFTNEDLRERNMNRLEAETVHLIDVGYAVSERIAWHYDIVSAEGGAIWQDKSGTRDQTLVAGHRVFALTRLGHLPFDIAASIRLEGPQGVALGKSFKQPLKKTDHIPPLLNGFVEKLIEQNGGVDAQVECVRRILHEQPRGKTVSGSLLFDVIVKDLKPKLLVAIEKSIDHVKKELRPEVLAELSRGNSFVNSPAGRHTQRSVYSDRPMDKVSGFPILSLELLKKCAQHINQNTPKTPIKCEVERRLVELSARRRLEE